MKNESYNLELLFVLADDAEFENRMHKFLYAGKISYLNSNVFLDKGFKVYSKLFKISGLK